MKRHAILIGRTGITNPLAGVEVDLNAYSNFLKSPIGGAWSESEITQLLDKGPFVVHKALNEVPEDAYCLVVYAGHAHTDDNGRLVLDIPGGPTFTNESLRTKASLQLTILDCCRDSQQLLPSKFPMKLVEGATVLNPSRSRAAFEHQLRLAGTGHVEIHSCAANEKSLDFSKSGGLYSQALLNQVTIWAATASRGPTPTFLAIGKAHADAVPVVTQSSGQEQHPKISSDQTDLEMRIPFAVVA